jgi:hypothetical protein
MKIWTMDAMGCRAQCDETGNVPDYSPITRLLSESPGQKQRVLRPETVKLVQSLGPVSPE